MTVRWDSIGSVADDPLQKWVPVAAFCIQVSRRAPICRLLMIARSARPGTSIERRALFYSEPHFAAGDDPIQER
jgi:hypothetical protein